MESTRTVGRYELLRELGAGGMAVVHLARQPGLDRFVAIKELRSFQTSTPELALRFVREARVSGLMSHPNVLTVFDFFEHDGVPYIAMEYLPRGSLRPFMDGLTLPQVGGVLGGMLAGLAHAERHGIVHRDLKPENLLVTDEGRVKIADFGIAKALGDMPDATVTRTGGMLGTPAYMAPEQALGGDIGPWTDLYAVGVIAYELFTGRRPFHNSPAPMLLDGSVPPARAANPAVPVEISDWVDGLLIKDPASRVRSAGAAQHDLEDMMSDLLGSNWRRQAPLEHDESAPTGDASAPTGDASGSTGDASGSNGEASRSNGEASGSAGMLPPVGRTPRRTEPATPPPRDLPPGPLFPGPIDVPTGVPTPEPARPRRGPRWRWLAAAVAVAAAAVAAAVAVAMTGSHAPSNARFKAAVAAACKLAESQQNARPSRTRALNRALDGAKTWQQTENAVYFDAQESLRDADTLSASVQLVNAPKADRAAVGSAVSTLTKTSNSYRAYLLRLNNAGTAAQLEKTVATFQAPDQVPVRVALGDLGGPGCLSQPPAPVKSASLFSPAVVANNLKASGTSKPAGNAVVSGTSTPSAAAAGTASTTATTTTGVATATSSNPTPAPNPTPSPAPNPSSGSSSSGAATVRGGGSAGSNGTSTGGG